MWILKDKMTLANYLYALVYSDMYDENKWQDWGEKLSEKLPENTQFDDNTEWVYNIKSTNDKEELLYEILPERIHYEDYSSYNMYDLAKIIQGYYYYQYKNNKISISELLEKSAIVEDPRQGRIHYKFFYELLSKMDKDSKIVNTKEFMNTIYNYFNPLYIAAMEQKTKLESATTEDLIL